jgi:hypothetical protein
MKRQILLVFLFWGFLAAACSGPKQEISADSTGREETMVQAAFDDDVLEKKIGRYKKVRIPYDPSIFSEKEQKAVELLYRAARIMDYLFWEQASSIGPELRQKLKSPKSQSEQLLAHYLAINYGPYDRLDEMEPFVKVPARPLGATFYPSDMTKDEFASFLEKHPDQKEAFQGWFTLIRRKGGDLIAVPYSQAYENHLKEASGLLKQAAGMVENQSLAKYLKSRAEAFLSDQYRQSDMDWMDVKDSRLEVTIGPYEVYEDHLFNYKAAFECFITAKDPEESRKLARVAAYVKDMEAHLPIDDKHKNFERGASSPILVTDLIYSAGDTRAGVQTLAFNLPNDEVVREQKGSKKVMLKNISHAKFDAILKPIAERVVLKQQQEFVTFDAYFNHTLMHEVSHGLGPGLIAHQGKRVPVNLLLKEQYTTVEEAKADVLGVYNTLFLISKKELPEGLRKETLATFLAGFFRSVRFGVHESHGRANLLAFNYLLEHGAYRYHSEEKCFSVDLDKAPGVVEALAKEILMIQALGDYEKAKAFVDKYVKMGAEIQGVLNSLKDIPVDIEPQFEIEEKLEG